MSFCTNCGESLNNASFCPSCGTPVGNVSVTKEVNTPSIALEQMNSLKVHFEPSRLWHLDLLSKQVKIANLERKSFTFLFVAPIIWYILLFLMTRREGFLQVLASIGALGIPGHIMLVVRFLLVKRNKKTILKETEEANALWEKIQNLYDAYGPCPVEIGYTSPAVLDSLYTIVRNGRAKTVGDAITILEQDLHNQRVEASAAEAIKLAQDTAEAAKSTARSAALTAWNTRRW